MFYKVKFQNTVATSSTEAEFIAVVSGAKTSKCLRTVLIEIGHSFYKPTKIKEDNMATIFMTNNNRPTERTRHMHIPCFALHQWVKEKHVVLHHVPGI